MKRFEGPFVVFAGVLVLCLLLPHHALFSQTCTSNSASSYGIVPSQEGFPGGQPQCGNLKGIRITPGDGAETIVENLDGVSGNDITVEITVVDCGEVLSWSVPDNIVVDQVVAKGGTDQNVYDYSGEGITSDGNLHCPTVSSGKYAGFSHIDICFHYKLDIEKTAVPEFTRTYEWMLTKSCDGENPLTLAVGQTFNYPFSWTAEIAGYTDSDWQVTGLIMIENNTPETATITSVSDVLSDGTVAAVSCDGDFTLLPGEALECGYTAELPGAINGINTVTVETCTPLVEGGTATAPYTFGDPTTQVDASIQVTDDCQTTPVTVNLADAPNTHSYTCQVGPYEACGEYTYTNTASFVTADLGITGSDNCVITVDVPCGGGCTRTLGYWKTHSKYGPAPYDDVWGGKEDETFFLSGQSYYEVLWTPPAGNVYYNLAHQYIAAEMNFLAGADPSAVQSTFDAATALLSTNSPNDAAGLKGKDKKPWTELASTLDDYNNGDIGPGHCDEDDTSLDKQVGEAPLDNSESPALPSEFALEQNYPNPFNPTTTIQYALPAAEQVTVTIYDISGRIVSVLVNEYQNAGSYSIRWNAAEQANGVYFYQLTAGSFTQVKRMVLLK